MVGRGWSSLVGRSRSNRVSGSSSVLDISNISTIGIINLVVNSLLSAIRKSNRVRSSGSISITVLSSLEVGSRVVISNSIVVGIHSRLIISWLLVGRGMDGSVVGRGGLGNNRGVVGRGMQNWGSMVDRGRGMIGSRSISRNSSRSMDSSNRLLTVMVGSDRLRSSMRLAGYRSMGSSMGFVNRNTDRGSISMLDHLVVGLVSCSCSKQGKANEGLK